MYCVYRKNMNEFKDNNYSPFMQLLLLERESDLSPQDERKASQDLRG